jgi:hypothetical protein
LPKVNLNSFIKYSKEFGSDIGNTFYGSKSYSSSDNNDKKSFVITSEYGEALIMPADEELIRIYTEHNEAP